METEILVHLYIDRLRSKSVLGYLFGCNTSCCFASLYLFTFSIDVRLSSDVAVAMASPWFLDVRLNLACTFSKYFSIFLVVTSASPWRCVHTKYTHLLKLPIPEKRASRGEFVHSEGSLGSFFVRQSWLRWRDVCPRVVACFGDRSCPVSLPLMRFRSRGTPRSAQLKLSRFWEFIFTAKRSTSVVEPGR